MNYLSYTGQCEDGYESERLREWVCYSANRLSYHDVVKEIDRVTGDRLLSAPRIRQLVVSKADQISQKQAQQVKQTLQNSSELPQLRETVDVYAPDSEEILLMCDGISVKRQKAQRGSLATLSTTAQEPKRVTTDVVMLQQSPGQFRYLMAGLNQETNLGETLKAALIDEYHHYPSLNLVAVTDGARNIRRLFEQVFGQPVTLILDWYHLRKKCYELLSMIARNKSEKETHIQIILAHLWQGQTAEALAYLHSQVMVTQLSLKNCSPICTNIPLKSSTMKNGNSPVKLSVRVAWKKALTKPLVIGKNARALEGKLKVTYETSR